MKPIFLLPLLFQLYMTAHSNAQETLPLWEDSEAPHYRENNLREYEKELWGTRCVFEITEPTLSIYPAQAPNTGKAVIILPGGGYELVALYHEGHDIAETLAKAGITAAVLKYRLPNPQSSDRPEAVPLSDVRRALKLLRSQSEQHPFDVQQVGLMGFSAGSHLATVASLWKSDDTKEMPNFSALIYGVTVLSKGNIKWLEESLYHRKMTPEELKQNRLLDQVDDATPPAFLVHAYDDDVCPVEESTRYAERLRENDVPVEMHLFPKGGHGFGAGRKKDGTDQWLPLFINWMKTNEF